MIDFVNNSEPDLTAENLNKMQQDIGTVVSATEPQGSERLKVWIQKGKNLFDGNYKENYGYDNSTGDIVQISTVYSNQSIISIPLGATKLILSKNGETKNTRFFFYNESKTYITSIAGLDVLIPENARYINFQIAKDTVNNDFTKIQVETENLTSYEAYIEPKIYVLNNSNVYEEFIKKATEFKIVSTMGSKDFNTFTKNGFYQCNFQNGTNAPDTYSTGMLLVFGNYYIAQLYIADLNSKAKAFVRMSTNQGASWNSWVTLA